MVGRVAFLPVVLLLSCGERTLGDRSCVCATAIGASECGTDDACLAIAENTVQGLMTPQVSPYQVLDSACAQTGVQTGAGWIEGLACQCKLEGGGTLLVGPTGVPCSFMSRGGGCLWDTTAWPACEAMVADACAGTCAELEARLRADAARVFDTQVRHASCGGVYCDIVVRIEDRCYVRSPSTSPAYDCALSDDQILAAERARLGGGVSTGAAGSSGAAGAGGASGGCRC